MLCTAEPFARIRQYIHIRLREHCRKIEWLLSFSIWNFTLRRSFILFPALQRQHEREEGETANEKRARRIARGVVCHSRLIEKYNNSAGQPAGIPRAISRLRRKKAARERAGEREREKKELRARADSREFRINSRNSIHAPAFHPRDGHYCGAHALQETLEIGYIKSYK